MSQVTVMPDVLTLEETAHYLRLPKQSLDSHTILLQQAGALADDETLPELCTTIYVERGRPETDEEMK